MQSFETIPVTFNPEVICMIDENPIHGYIVKSGCELVGLGHSSMCDPHHSAVRTVHYKTEVSTLDLQVPNVWLDIVLDVAKEEFIC